MPFCGNCGHAVGEGVAFCPQCGAPVGAAAASAPPGEWSQVPAGSVGAGPAGAAPAGVAGPGLVAPASGLRENVAGMLCYLVGWITGLIFLLIDKRPFVRFHAAQSIAVFGLLNLIRLVFVFGLLGPHSFSLFSIWSLISLLLSLLTFILWVVLMITAYQGRRVEIPIAASIAKSIAGNTAF